MIANLSIQFLLEDKFINIFFIYLELNSQYLNNIYIKVTRFQGSEVQRRRRPNKQPVKSLEKL
jgi:hypothetical protein